MIGYHPARDPYHTIVRFVRLLDIFDRPVEFERLRIADFLLLFPEHVHDMSIPRGDMGLRSSIPRNANPYWRNVDAALLFRQMASVHTAALNRMIAAGTVHRTIADLVELIPGAVPQELAAAAYSSSLLTKEIQSLVEGPLTALPIVGQHGLKARSALMEYRYDGS